MLAIAAPAGADVTDFIGQPIASVRLVLDGHETTDPALMRVVAVRSGQPLSMRDVRETVLHLFATSRFADVQVDAVRQGTGVAVRFDLTAVRPVSHIVFAGSISEPGVDEGQLRRVVTDRAGPSPPLTRVDELSRLVEAALRTRGYLHAKVTSRADTNASDHTALVFTVEAGARSVIGSIDVTGAAAATKDLQTQLQVVSGAPFEREAVMARVDKYVAGRRKQGYYEAKVTLVDQPADGDRVVNLTLTVDPGRHVSVVFAGDSFPGEKKDLVPFEREGSVDEDLLEDSTARIEDALKSQGYKDARAPHERAERDGEVVITFRVTRGQQYRVSKVTINGNASVPLTDLQPALTLREGQSFSQASLDGEAGSIEDIYRRSGFGAAKADIGVVPQAPVSGQVVPVDIAFSIREGVKTQVGSVKVSGNASIPEATLVEGLRLQPGRPFVIASLAADRDAILVRYLNAGYESATVEARPEVNRERTQANVVYAVREGPRVLVDHILIVGPEHTDASIVEKQLQLHEGDPLSLDAVRDSQRRLQSLGLYRNVTISELRHGEENRRDLLVSVEEGPSTSVAYGGGFEIARRVEISDTGTATERLDAAPRASFQISRRNLFGTNRSATFFSSLTLHPQGTEQGNSGVTEYRLVGNFREPQIFNTRVDGLITLTTEQQFRSSFNFRRKSATGEATRRFSKSISLIGTYQLQKTEVYDNRITDPADLSAIDRVFPRVLLSSFSLSVLRDTRNDQIAPTHGEYFSAYGQIAARAIGSQVGFIKSFFRASTFQLLPHSRGIVLAGNAFLGVATGFPQQDATGLTIVDENGQPVRDLPQSERFYAGGDTTMRGFTLDQLGVHHTPAQAGDTIDDKGFPLGGNSELLFNVELRVPVWRQLEMHGFIDTGNVFKRAIDLDLGQFRTAYGVGVLYKSPVGPIRFDLGFKVHPQPGESLTAFFVTFGQAF